MPSWFTPVEPVQWIDNPVSEPEETTDETSTDNDEPADVPYDADLVECCKTWREGGMAKAYKIIGGFFTIKPNPNDAPIKFTKTEEKKGKAIKGRLAKPYIIKKTDHVAHPASLTDVKEVMEDFFDEMCDAWFDYTRSDDYNEETDADLFDDQVDWMDFCHQAITEDTVKMMMS